MIAGSVARNGNIILSVSPPEKTVGEWNTPKVKPEWKLIYEGVDLHLFALLAVNTRDLYGYNHKIEGDCTLAAGL